VQLAFEAGDGAEGAALVAAFGDLDIGMIGGAGDNPVGLLTGEIDLGAEGALFLEDECIDLLVVAHTGEDIDLRHTLLQLLLIALCQAAAHDQQGALLALCMEAKYGVDRLLFGRLDEAAGVDDDYIGCSRIITEGIFLQPAQHDLRIDKVFGAA